MAMQNSRYSTPLFLSIINPFLLFIYSIYNYRQNWAKNTIWFFVVFFGFTFAIGSESTGSDINRYIEEFINLSVVELSISEAYDYYIDSGELDIFRTLIAVILSQVTDDAVWLTTIYGLFFGYFYSRNIFSLLHFVPGRFSLTTWLFVIVIIIIVPFWNINGFRFWTAFHVFIFGLIPFFTTQNKKGIIFCFLSIAFHFAFLIPFIVLVIFYFVPKRLVIVFSVFIVSIVYQEMNVSYLFDRINKSGYERLVERTEGYTHEEVITRSNRTSVISASRNWYANLYKPLFSYFLVSCLILIFIMQTYKNFLKGNEKLIFMYVLWFYAFSNFVSTIPMGGRFLPISLLLASFFVAYIYQKYSLALLNGLIIPLSLPILILYIIVSIRNGFYFLSINTVFGNWVTAFVFYGDNFALNDFLK